MSQPGLPSSTTIVMYLSARWPHGSTYTIKETRRKAPICDVAKHVQGHIVQSSVKHAPQDLCMTKKVEKRVKAEAYAACKQG